MTINHTPHRPWAGRIHMAMATALCATALLGAAPASAGTVIGTIDGLTVSTIDVNGQGSLTVIIAPHNPYDDVPAGQLPPGDLAGTVFTAHRIESVNLGTQAGWVQAEAMTIEAARDATYTHVFTATTDGGGRATFTGLPVGVYYVTTTVPDDDQYFYRTPQDMLLTIPVGQQDQWQYNVVINAKYEPTTPPATTPPTSPPTTPPATTPPTSPPTTPVTPGTPTTTTPGAPGTPEVPGQPTRAGIERLPVTGASVLWAMGIAALLVAVGIGLIGVNKRRSHNGGTRK